MNSTVSFKAVILQDLWLHVAGVIAIGFGLSDLWYFHALSHDSDLLFVIGGMAGMGLKIVNGSAAALREAALTTALQAAQVATAVASAAAAPATPNNPPSSTGG